MPSIRIDFEHPCTSELYFITQELKKLQNRFKITILKEECYSDFHTDPQPPVDLAIRYEVRSSVLPFPETLLKITIEDSPYITSLPPFPANLRGLTIKNCPNLTTLPNFPQTIEDLHIENTPITSLPCDTIALESLCLLNTNIQVLPSMKSLPRLECNNNPFHAFYKHSLCDMDPNQVEDFLEDYEPKAVIVRKKLKEGVPFDAILKEL